MKRLAHFTLGIVCACAAWGCVTVKTENDEPVLETSSYIDSRLETLRRQVDEYPKRHDLHHQIAQTYFQMGEFRESITSLEAAIDLAPDQVRYHYDLGRVYLRMGENPRAEKSFRRAAKLCGDRYSGPHAALGYVQAVGKKFDEALVSFEHCVSLEPENPEYYYFLGSIHDIRRDREKTIRYYTEYLDRGGSRFREKVAFVLGRLGIEVPPADDDAPYSGEDEDSEGFLPSELRSISLPFETADD